MTDYSKLKQTALNKNPWPVESKNGLPLVFSPLLKKYAALVHAFTTRQGGKTPPPRHSFNISMPKEGNEHLRLDARSNRQRLCESLNLPFERLTVSGRQVHAASVVMLEAKAEPGEVDGMATCEIHSPLIVQAADCVPILIYDPKQNAVCVVHAGWRGTAAAISKEAVKVMSTKSGSNPKDLVAAIGPAIGPCCYPVGLEVVIELVKSFEGETWLKAIETKIAGNKNSEILKDKKLHAGTQAIIENLGLDGFFTRDDHQIHVDLKAINAYQLLQSGIANIDVTDFCTFCRPDLFYSFRRAYVNKEGATGHQGAIACLMPL